MLSSTISNIKFGIQPAEASDESATGLYRLLTKFLMQGYPLYASDGYIGKRPKPTSKPVIPVTPPLRRTKNLVDLRAVFLLSPLLPCRS